MYNQTQYFKTVAEAQGGDDNMINYTYNFPFQYRVLHPADVLALTQQMKELDYYGDIPDDQ